MREFLLSTLNGLTVAALYFVAASGFSLIFGFLQVVNMSHGAMLLLGGYIGFTIEEVTGSWVAAILGAAVAMYILAVLMHELIIKKAEGEVFRQVLLTIGVATILADVMLILWGGNTYQLDGLDILDGFVNLPLIGRYSMIRLFLILFSIGVGVTMWAILKYTRVGSLIRAGVDDQEILGAVGVDVIKMQKTVFGIGSAIVAVAGVMAASALSISPGEDSRYLLVSLIVVIVGGMGSIAGTAIGSVLIGLAEQYGLTYAPTYAVTFTFIILILTLAFRPSGIVTRK